MAFEQLSNNAITTLASSITNSATSLTVTSATNFPSSGNFRIIVETEIMLVTAVSGTTFTVTRGIESTTAAAHDADVNVVHGVTAGGIEALFNDYMPLQTDRKGPYNSLTNVAGTVLTASSFTWLNQGTSTTTDLTEGGIGLTIPSGTGANIRGKYISVSAPWTVTMAMLPTGNWDGGAGIGHFGLMLYDSVSSQIVTHAIQTNNTVRILNYTNTTTYASDLLSARGYGVGAPIWLQVEDDNTNLYYRVSTDGIHFNTVTSGSRTAFLTNGPDNAGFYMNSNSTADGSSLSLVHWSME